MEIDPNSSAAGEIKAEFGDKLMDTYMEILNDDDSWATTAECFMSKKPCFTPLGMLQRTGLRSKTVRELRWYTAGTVCVDVSTFGNRKALLGESSASLAIFIAYVKRTQPQVVTHECTSYFGQYLFEKFLPGYKVHRISMPPDADKLGPLKAGFQSETWLLSPHQMGWPCYRPRRGFCMNI